MMNRGIATEGEEQAQLETKLVKATESKAAYFNGLDQRRGSLGSLEGVGNREIP